MRYFRGMTIGDGEMESQVWQFTVADDLNTGDSVSDATITSDAGITVTKEATDSDSVYVRIDGEGATKGSSYQINVVVDTAAGNTIDMLVNYAVANP